MTTVASPVRGTRMGEFSICSACGETVYEARRDDGVTAALKLSRDASRLEHEASVLRQLSGCATPEVLARGSSAGDTYLALAWRRGIEVRRATAEARLAGDRAALLDVAVALLRAYADIHARGVVHGNVHPRHVLVDRDASVSVLDFAPGGRPLGMLSSPADAEAWLAGEQVVVPAARDEQYSLAALVYLLLCGRMYFRAAGERSAVARQILLTRAPLPFAEHGEAAWPGVESTLARGLSTERSERYGSVGELADALEAMAADAADRVVARVAAGSALRDHLEQFRRLTRVPGGLSGAPICSVNHGAAGIAFALYRIARAYEDRDALEAAAAWIALAERQSDCADAFYSDLQGVTRESVGSVSPFHTASGLALVRALMCRYARDGSGEQRAIDAYLLLTDAPCSNLDLTLGLSSVLLGGALLLDGVDPGWEVTERLRRRGDALVGRLWAELPRSPLRALGVAHGRAGLIYATLLWSRVRRVAPPAGARELLDELAWLAEPHGRGLRWPWRSDDSIGPEAYWPGWCGGQAGQVFLWTLAADVYGEPDLLDIAEQAAWSTWDQPARVTSLCCGSAGQAYALLNLYRGTGERAWLTRATARAGHAAASGVLAEDAVSPVSLYKGHAGLAVLAAELRAPELAAMPLFEPESPSLTTCL